MTLPPEEVIRRARIWGEIFDAKDNRKTVKAIVLKKLKASYKVVLKDWNVEARLVTKKDYKEGDEVSCLIKSANYVSKQIVLKDADYEEEERKILSKILKAKEKNRTMKAQVIGVSNGSLIIDILGQKGVVPPAHIPKKFSDRVSALVGKTVRVKILRVRTNNILASMRINER